MAGTYYYIVILVAGGALLFIGYGLTGFLMKNPQGAWDSYAKNIGRIRARRWRYKQQVPVAQDFLLPEITSNLAFWPGVPAAKGSDTVQANQTEIWRSAFVQVTAQETDLYFTYTIPQRSDGAEFSIPEVAFTCITYLPDEVADKTKTWTFQSATAQAVQALGNSQFALWLESLQRVRFVHLIDNRLTLAVVDKEFDDHTLALLDTCIAYCKEAARVLPQSYWDAN